MWLRFHEESRLLTHRPQLETQGRDAARSVEMLCDATPDEVELGSSVSLEQQMKEMVASQAEAEEKKVREGWVAWDVVGRVF